MDDTVENAAVKNLMNVDPECKKLDDEKSEIFHSVVAKLLLS